MVGGGEGGEVQGGGRLAEFSSARGGGAKVSTEGRTLRYEIRHKNTHKGIRVIEQPVNPNVARQKTQ